PCAPLLLFSTDTSTTEIYTLSLHDALPISPGKRPTWWSYKNLLRVHHPAARRPWCPPHNCPQTCPRSPAASRSCRSCQEGSNQRSEEHTSELQSLTNLVCRLLLEKKKHTPH